MAGPKDDQLQVSTEALQKFATNLRTEATDVSSLGAGEGFNFASGALPGTDFGTVVTSATDTLNNCLTRINERLSTVADNMQNAAGKFELAEEEFTNKLKTIGLEVK
ncbi:type VII secretion target [Nocardia sp. NPDC051832]|uniref:type VII secretion target n=1 Tax=Nocardia sp. NPDC051832 TaxID=3155673 RepID=UPI0034411EAA